MERMNEKNIVICTYLHTCMSAAVTPDQRKYISIKLGVIECDLFNQTCSMEPILVRKILAIWILQWPFGPVRIDAHVMSTIVDYLQRNVLRGQQYVSNCIRASS